MYDVIIVGARVAGSATALLLARRGLKVLVLDRAAFPSDTLSTHQVQVPGSPGWRAGESWTRSWPRAPRRPGTSASIKARR
jgi:glycine/D-amino acid oxidase-like deaminating enzyme